MEVEVLDHEGLAPETIIMIRAGQMRRQAKLNTGLPFQFPSLPSNANPFRVEVFQTVGSKSLSLSPDAQNYKVRIPAARDLDKSTLELLIQEPRWTCPECGEESRMSKTECYNCGNGRPKDAQATAADAAQGTDTIDTNADDPVKKDSATERARDYLQKHNLVNFVQEMLATVLKEKPSDPYGYMSAHARGRLLGNEKPLNDTATTAALPSRESPRVNCDDADDDDDFGEDREQVGFDLPEGFWYVAAPQQAIRLHGENCTLTIMQNDMIGHIRFEVHQPSINDTLFAVCTKEQFDKLCEEVGGFGSEQTNRAITRIFQEHWHTENKCESLDGTQNAPDVVGSLRSVSPECEVAQQLAASATEYSTAVAVEKEALAAAGVEVVSSSLAPQPPAEPRREDQPKRPNKTLQRVAPETPDQLEQHRSILLPHLPSVDCLYHLTPSHLKPSVGTWNLRRRPLRATASTPPASATTAVVEVEVEVERQLAVDNERLVGSNEVLRAEIARLKSMFGEDALGADRPGEGSKEASVQGAVESENLQLKAANLALLEANQKLRQDNESLHGKLRSSTASGTAAATTTTAAALSPST